MSLFPMDAETAARNHSELILQHVQHSDRQAYAATIIRMGINILVQERGSSFAHGVLHVLQKELR